MKISIFVLNKYCFFCNKYGVRKYNNMGNNEFYCPKCNKQYVEINEEIVELGGID